MKFEILYKILSDMSNLYGGFWCIRDLFIKIAKFDIMVGMNNLNTFPSVVPQEKDKKFIETLTYLQEKFFDLENDYSTSDGNHAQSCSLIATKVASLLKKEGGSPQILIITGMKVDSVNTETLYPRRYEGRVKWGGHVVCECGGVVYDPMLGIPVNTEEYLKTAFLRPALEGEIVDLKIQE